MSADEIRHKREIGGKNHILVCRHFFDKNAEMSSLCGCASMKQKKNQSERTKK